MVAFWLLVFGLWHPAMVPSMDRDEPTPGLVAELVEAFRTSDRVLEPVSYTHLTLPTNREV